MSVISFNPKVVANNLLSCLKDRAKDVVVQRFGLDESLKRKTLAAIGQRYGITRERVRQIENFGINAIRKGQLMEVNRDAFDELKDVFHQHGKIVSEREILERLAGEQPVRNHIFFLLVLGDDFVKLDEDEEFNHRWTIDNESADQVHEVLRRLHKEIKNEDLIPEKEIISLLKEAAEEIIKEEIRDEIALNWLNISKVISRNSFGDWGLASSPNVRPSGIRDLTFLVLRKHGSPMHFSEAARRISDIFKKANPATVHNELIKDKRFVLVGRGIYALGEWGYKPGTVQEIIKGIIKAHGPLPQDEIIKAVLKERYVKENTIIVNLQNRNFFKRNEEGRYVVA